MTPRRHPTISRCAAASLLAVAMHAADGAVELTDPADVRARRAATRNRHDAPVAASTTAVPTTAATTTTDGTHHHPPARSIAARLATTPPAGHRPPSMMLGVEQGWYGMSIHNGTDPSSTGQGSLGVAHEVGYAIDPFVMTRIAGTGRVDRLGFTATWANDPTDTAAGEAFGLAMLLFTPDDGGWWQGSVAHARLRGTATTIGAGGGTLSETVDSRWNTLSIERRLYPLLLWGVQYEDLDMPSAYSLDDPDGQVIAIFDDTTRWRTMSFICGIDSANAAAVERRTGLRALYEVKLGLGLGIMSYDEAGARRIAESHGYAFDDDGAMVLTVSGEVALGIQGTVAWRGLAADVAVGGRVRGMWLGTGDHEPSDGERPDHDTLHLHNELSAVMYGLFARIGVAF